MNGLERRPGVTVSLPPYANAIVFPLLCRRLEGCLGTLASQRYDSEKFEVIVVDDGSGNVPERGVMASTGDFNCGRCAYHFRRALARRKGPALKLEPLGFYGRPRSYSLVALRGRRAMAATAPFAAAQIATAFAFICEALTGTAIPHTYAAGRSNDPAL